MNVLPYKSCLHLLHSTQAAILTCLKSAVQQNVLNYHFLCKNPSLPEFTLSKGLGAFLSEMPKKMKILLTFAKTVP